MKIAISGTHGTGKSTKALEFATYHKKHSPDKKIFLLQENIINCPLPFNKQTTMESQMWIVADQIKAEIEASEKYDIVICDRCVFDPIAYANACGLTAVGEMLYKFLRHWGQSYDRIYLMGGVMNNYIYDDGLRDTDTEFRMNVDTQFKEIFEQLNNQRYINGYEII